MFFIKKLIFLFLSLTLTLQKRLSSMPYHPIPS